MTRSNSLLKLAAIAGYIVLVGGFVSYRAGAFTWLKAASTGPAAISVETGPSGLDFMTEVLGMTSEPAPADDTQAIMPGSKSGILAPAPGWLVPATPRTPPPGAEPPAPVQPSKPAQQSR